MTFLEPGTGAVHDDVPGGQDRLSSAAGRPRRAVIARLVRADEDTARDGVVWPSEGWPFRDLRSRR